MSEDLSMAVARVAELLQVAARFIAKNRLNGYTIYYDEAHCDGHCLRQDIQVALDHLRAKR